MSQVYNLEPPTEGKAVLVIQNYGEVRPAPRTEPIPLTSRRPVNGTSTGTRRRRRRRRAAAARPPRTAALPPRLRPAAHQVDIEFWPREAPLACRNFIQHALEGYYDNTVFHRVIAKFMLQGGDPTGTGKGGEAAYGEPFRAEIHSRIRFNHRGQLAMATEEVGGWVGGWVEWWWAGGVGLALRPTRRPPQT